MKGVEVVKIKLKELLEKALACEKSFIHRGATKIMIEPRGAVVWILSMRPKRSLIPAPLIQHLESIASPSPKRKGGRPPAADWDEIEKALNKEIDLVGLPLPNGVPGWRTITDAIKWVEELTGKDTPGKTALKENVGAMIQRATIRKAGN
jgi:hypothetical protein